MEEFVSPGDKLAMEEEYAPSSNTYVEEGTVYAAAAGARTIKDGMVSVTPLREIRGLDRGMLVLGVVTDTMKSVIFVEINRISAGRKEYLALKDGKIILRKQFDRRPPPGRSYGDRNRERPRDPQEEKPCGTGDTIMAKVVAEENDTYVLSLNSPEAGVVHSTCSNCGGQLQIGERPDTLYCASCRRSEHKKVSTYYDKPEEIKKYFDNVT